ncbi:MAG TPA: ABC transporter substrate-binding protein [Methylomirabilota bacterium]|nr:ABC transporter substrate-binding protein [Methylomirabilota bacterium]
MIHPLRLARRCLVVTLVLGLGLIATVVRAGEPTDTMRDFFGAVNLVLADPRTEDQPLEKLRAIRKHVDDVFDFREAAMLALGREWSAHPRVEQNEFVALFADLLERSFVWRVAGKASLGGGVKVQYLGETVAGDAASVDTTIASRDGGDLKLEYRMVRRAERWVVRDVIMDGVSTMENYHAQFQRVVRDASWPDLMAQLRAKVAASSVQVAGAAPAPPEPAMPGLDADRAVSDNRVAAANDLAAVVTPGLAVRDVNPVPVPRPRLAAPTDVPAAGPSREITQAPTPRGSTGSAATIPLVTPRPPRGDEPREPALQPTPGPGAPASGASLAVSRYPSRMAALTPPAEPVRVTPKPLGARPAATPVFWIQVGAFRNATVADRVAQRVRGEIFVAPSASGARTEPLLRVRVGPFAERGQAVARLRELQGLGYQPFIAAP